MKKALFLMMATVAILSFSSFTTIKTGHVVHKNRILPPVGTYIGSLTISSGGDYDGSYDLYALPSNTSKLTYAKDADGNNYLITGTYNASQGRVSIKFSSDPTGNTYSGYVIINQE